MKSELKEFRNENLISVDWFFPEEYDCVMLFLKDN